MRKKVVTVIAAVVTASALSTAWSGAPAPQAQSAPPAQIEPTNSAPNPYETVEGYFKMPEGRTWGSTSAVDIDKDGQSIWVAVA